MTVHKSTAWCSYVSVVKALLGKKRANCYQDIVKQMLTNFETLGAKMSIKIRHLFSHLDRFPDNLGEVSEKQGERFDQAIKTLTSKSTNRHHINVTFNKSWTFEGRLCFVYIGMKFQCQFAMYSSLFSDTQFIHNANAKKMISVYLKKLDPIWKN